MKSISLELLPASSLYVVPTKKFKTITIQMVLKGSAKREEASALALLAQLLATANEKYPSMQVFSAYKETLYGTKVMVSSKNHGWYNAFMIQVSTIDESFLASPEKLLEKQFQLLQMILYSPFQNKNHNGFDQTYFQERRRIYTQQLQSMDDEKESYASMRINDLVPASHPFSIRSVGYVDELPNLQNQDVFAVYRSLLERNFDLYVIGNVRKDRIRKLALSYLKYPPHEVKEEPIILLPDWKPETKVEQKEFNQSQLNMIVRLPIAFGDELEGAAILLNGMFGGTALSRLFKVVREEHGLCYSIYSQYYVNYGFMLVSAGIDASSYKKAIELIQEQLEQLQKGNFQISELRLTKKLILTSLERQQDNPSSLISSLMNNVLNNSNRTMEEYRHMIKQVKKGQIIEAAKQASIVSTYFLKQEDK